MKAPILFLISIALTGFAAAAAQSPLTRNYTEGEFISYKMTGTNVDGQIKHAYSLNLKGIVQMEASKTYSELFGLSNFVFDGQSIDLDTQSLKFTERVSLDPRFDNPSHYPDQSKIDTRLKAPSDDLFNIYVDLQLVAKLAMLQKAGDNIYINYAKPTSWDNGHGQTCVDFKILLESIDLANGIAVVSVHHVPPKTECVNLPAAWMKDPVVNGMDTNPNNVVDIQSRGDSQFNIIVGKENIDVTMRVGLVTGKLISADLIDSLILVERLCADSLGRSCQSPKTYPQQRVIRLNAE